MGRKLLLVLALSVLSLLTYDKVFATEKHSHDIAASNLNLYAEISTEEESWYNTRYLVLKVSYPGDVTSSGKLIGIYDGLLCMPDPSSPNSGIDGVGPGSATSTVLIEMQKNCTGSASGGPSDPGFIQNFYFCPGASFSGSCSVYSSAGMSAADWSYLNMNSDKLTYDADSDSTSGYIHVLNSPGNYSNLINAFKVSASGGHVGPIGTNSNPANPIEISQIIRGSGSKHDRFNTFIEFAAPCDYSGGIQRIEFSGVGYGTDLDGVGSEWSPNLTRAIFENVTTGEVYRSVSDGTLGTNEDDRLWRSWSFQPDAGHNYRVTWADVGHSNSIRTKIPFDAPDFNFSCDTSIEGRYDFHSCDGAGGFAYDTTNFDEPVEVRVYIDNKDGSGYNLALTIPAANLPSTDIDRGDPGGNHRFTYDIPEAYRDGGSIKVSVRGVELNSGREQDLLESPREIVCDAWQARCTSIYIPTLVSVGDPFEAEVSFRNRGTQVWTNTNYELVSLGQEFGIVNASIAPHVVNAGEQKTFTLPLIAPDTAGLYNFEWAVRYIPTGEVINQRCTSSVRVVSVWDINKPSVSSIQAARQGGQVWDVRVTVRNGGSGGSYGAGGPGDGKVGVAYRFTKNGVVWAHPWTATTTPKTGLNIAARSSFTESFSLPVPTTLTYGDRICMVVDATIVKGRTGTDSIINNGPRRNEANTGCFLVGEQPYFTVEGGGLWAGGVIDPDKPEGRGYCRASDDTTGFIEGVFTGAVGTVSEHAAIARGYINGIASGHDPAINPNALIFENVGAVGVYTGDRLKGPCLVDYYSFLNHKHSGVNVLSSLSASFPDGQSSGQYFYDAGGPGFNVNVGDINLSAVAGNNKRITLIINGDVTIDGDIVNGNYSANLDDANPNNDIPIFMLVASGKIDIVSEVRQLDGLFVSREGGIDTCSNGPARLASAFCSEQLIINGAFVSDDLKLRRTFGGAVANQGPAELFRHTPDFNIATAPFVSDLLPQFRIISVDELPPAY